MPIRSLIRSPRRLRGLLLLAGVTSVAAGTVLLAEHEAPAHKNAGAAPIHVQDVSGRPTACLATDASQASASHDVEALWSAMRQAREPDGAHQVNVQQLAVPVTSAAAAGPYLAGLIGQHCSLIVTVGQSFGQAIPKTLAAHPEARFTAIDAGTLPPSPQITVPGQGNAIDVLRDQIRALAHA